MITRQDALDILSDPAECPCDDCNDIAVNQITGAIIGALNDMADQIDNGFAAPLPPSVIAELVRERASDLLHNGLEADDTDE